MIQIDNAIDKFRQIILGEMKEANINCWLAGGALRDYFMGIPIKTDYDMFFSNETEYLKARTYFKDKDCEIKWESDNGCKIKYKGRTYDLIKKFFPDPQTTIDAFDFTISMFAVDHERFYYGESSFIDLAKRQLMINKITYSASTLSRSFRYYKKGFTMCLGEMKKLFDAIQNEPKEEPKQTDVNRSDENTKEDMSSGELKAIFMSID